MSSDSISVSLYRFDPTVDGEPRYDTFVVPAMTHMRVLDALDYIYNELGQGFAYRWFCATKKCGMCGVTVNGKPQLACWEPAQPQMTIEPLRHFPVVRDLVVDFSENETQLTELRPMVQRSETSYPGFPEPVSHEAMLPHYQLTGCIDCRICVAACSVLDRPGSTFAGPYAMVQLAKAATHPYNQDSAAAERALSAGLDLCLSCNACSDACPSHLPILDGAIDELRDRLVRDGKYQIHFWWIIRRMPHRLRKFLRCQLWPRLTGAAHR